MRMCEDRKTLVTNLSTLQISSISRHHVRRLFLYSHAYSRTCRLTLGGRLREVVAQEGSTVFI